MSKAERKKLDMEIRLLRNTNFKKGEPDGFNRCLATGLFALMDVSNYKTPGITKVWDEMQAIDESIKNEKKGPQSGYYTIYDVLYEKFAVIVDDVQLEKAERFLAEYADDKSQKQQIANLKEMVALYKEAMASFVEFEPVEQYRDPIKNMKLNAAYEAYKKGIASGFFRFIGMFLYAVSRKTNYKRPGLMRIYSRILEIDKAIEDESCSLSDELLLYALYEETDLICYQSFVPLAQAYSEEYCKTGVKKGYYQQVLDILDAYYQN